MLETIAGFLSTSGAGALLGWIGGLANRYMDFKTKKLDIEIKKLDHAHELNLRDKDFQALKLEIDGKVEVAHIEGASRVEESANKALAESYGNDRATYGIRFVDAIRGLLRPGITVYFCLIIGFVNYKVWQILASGPDMVLTQAQVYSIIEWTLFEAAVVIGWWFANRPTSSPISVRRVK